MNKRKKGILIVGNWKMNPGSMDEAKVLTRAAIKIAKDVKGPTIVICPPSVYLQSVSDILGRTNSSVSLGVQNIFYEQSGAFTGEISGSLVTQFGVSYAIIGHSERRALGETNEMVNKKVKTALGLKIKPIICIGENTRDEEGLYLGIIKAQLETALTTIDRLALSKVVIAYEPVWAIGATKAMNARDIHEISIYIKKIIFDIYKIHIAVPILYGGSVGPENTKEILEDGGVVGLLIGRQSLDPKSFTAIAKSAGSF